MPCSYTQHTEVVLSFPKRFPLVLSCCTRVPTRSSYPKWSCGSISRRAECQGPKKWDFAFRRRRRKKFTALLTPDRVSAVTATAGPGALPAQKELNKAHPKIILHTRGNHRKNLPAAQRVYFKILAFDINKTKAVQDSLLCPLSNEHQHDNYIKIDWF